MSASERPTTMLVLVENGKAIGMVEHMEFSGGGRAPGRMQTYVGDASRDYVPGPPIERRIHLRVGIGCSPEMNAGPHAVFRIPDSTTPTVHEQVCRFCIVERGFGVLVGVVLDE